MLIIDWIKIFSLFDRGEENIHSLLKPAFRDIYMRYDNYNWGLSTQEFDDVVINKYAQVVAGITKGRKEEYFLKQKTKIKNHFRKRFDENLFDALARKALILNENEKVKVNCRKRFEQEQNQWLKDAKMELYANEGAFEKAFSGFVNSFINTTTNKGYRKTFFELFKTRLTDIIRCELMKQRGSDTKCWGDLFVEWQGLQNYFVTTYSLGKEDVYTAFVDAFVVLEQNVKNDKFDYNSSLKVYFQSIFRNKIIDCIRKKETHIREVEELNENTPSSHNWDDSLWEREDYANDWLRKFQAAIKKLDEKCQELFKMIPRRLDNQATANLLNWNEDQVRNKKSKCLTKLAKNMKLDGSSSIIAELWAVLFNKEME